MPTSRAQRWAIAAALAVTTSAPVQAGESLEWASDFNSFQPQEDGDLSASTRGGEDQAAGLLPWLAGNWQGTKGDGHIEETWSAPVGDNRMGMFRLVRNGTVVFYEFMSIEEEPDEGPVLRIKHFSKGLRGWEAADESEVFYLVDSGPREARFAQRVSEVPTRLIYRLTEDGELVIRLEKDRDEGTSVTEFWLTRR